VTDEIRAAGAVVWRPAAGADSDWDDGDGGQVVLVHRPKYDDWSLPKGKLEPAEHVLLAAVREVAEETALRVALGRRLPPVHYLASGAPKRVDYWAATAEEPAGAFAPNAEIDGLAWVAAEAAARSQATASPNAATGGAAVTYPRDADTVAAALAGPRHTTPLILVRHASAGHKSAWHGGDLSRPLDSEGAQDAQSLAALLRCFGVSRVVSAPAERCRATVRPYAVLTGGTVEVEPAFDVVGADRGRRQPADPRADVEEAAATLATAADPVIICAHRENLPALLAAVCAELGAPPPAEEPLRKGEFLVLHRAAGRLAAAERYHPDGQ
jgi:8-oxo-(d)GTP phosphatase